MADVGVDLKDLKKLVERCFHQDVRDRAHRNALLIGAETKPAATSLFAGLFNQAIPEAEKLTSLQYAPLLDALKSGNEVRGALAGFLTYSQVTRSSHNRRASRHYELQRSAVSASSGEVKKSLAIASKRPQPKRQDSGTCLGNARLLGGARHGVQEDSLELLSTSKAVAPSMTEIFLTAKPGVP
jgi:hypothetical protein